MLVSYKAERVSWRTAIPLEAIIGERVNWKKQGHYEALGGKSLEEWLIENHQGRAPSELVVEIGGIVGHDVSAGAMRVKCHKLGLRCSDEAYTRALQAGVSRVKAVQPIAQFNPDVVWEATKRLAGALRYRVEQTNHIVIDFSDEDRPIAIAELADMHIGGIGVDYEAIERDTEIIAGTDGMYCTIGGDTVDNFLESFFLSAMATQVITASVQWRLLEKHLSTIQDKVLYARVGNHEAWTAKVSQIDKFGELMCKYQILNVEHIGVADIFVGQQKYVVEASHKFWGNSRLNELHSAMRLLDYGIADNVDVAVVEHRHTPAAGWQHRRGKRRFFIRTGSYKIYDSYAAEHGFWGAEVAPACLIYWPDKHQIVILHDVPAAAAFLVYLRSGQP